MSRPVMSEPRQSPLCESGFSSRGSSTARLWSPPVVSITADAGVASPSGGTTTELAGFAVASLDAAIDGEELLLAMEDWEEATGTEREARVFSRFHEELEEARGWRKKTMTRENGVKKWRVSHDFYLSYSASRFVQLIGRLPRRRCVRERAR